MEKNAGSFPVGEQDLIKQGFIKTKSVGQLGRKYYVNYRITDTMLRYSKNKPETVSSDWGEVRWFDRYNIKYGMDADDIEVANGKLYDKLTHKQILLIKGPYKTRAMKKAYESVSFELYQKMLSLQQK